MKILCLIMLSLLNSVVFAESKIETIQLNHRLAIEVLPEIQPFLPEKATARAFNEFIILQAEPQVIANIKQLINKLDTPVQNLTVSVLKTDQALSDSQRTMTDANISIRDNDVSANLAIQHWSTSDSRNQDQQYQARGIAGHPIVITTGQAIPQKEQYLILNANGGMATQTTTRYIDLNNGFKAIATILPNHQVSIDIYPQFASLSKRNGMIERSQVFTSVSGAIGTWLEIGQISNQKNIERSGSTHYQTHQQQQHFIYLKVDEINSN